MSVTGKEIAQKLNVSEAAVSLALNNRPGVSTELKNRIISVAEEMGYEFKKAKGNTSRAGRVYVIYYKVTNVILSMGGIFDEMFDGIREECRSRQWSVHVLQFYEKTENLDNFISFLRASDCAGIILIGTEMIKKNIQPFLDLKIPLVLLECDHDALDCTVVKTNNKQGAYIATSHLINTLGVQPGLIQSSYSTYSYAERRSGYVEALSFYGMVYSTSVIHTLAPSIEGAMSDMLEIIDSGASLARCYFAMNDVIAIGAIKAFSLRGYHIPEDVAIIGFDNIREGRIVDPQLTTIDVPRFFLGKTAARFLIEQIEGTDPHGIKIEITTRLLHRFSSYALPDTKKY